MLRAVHRGAHQIVEAGVNQHEVVLARALGGAHLGQQHPRGPDQEATGLYFELDGVPKVLLDAAARVEPAARVGGNVQLQLALAVRDGQAAPRGEGPNVPPEPHDLTGVCATPVAVGMRLDPRDAGRYHVVALIERRLDRQVQVMPIVRIVA